MNNLRIGRNRFAAKIIAALLVVIVIPTALTSVLFYSVSSSLVKKNVRVSSLQLVRQAAGALSAIVTSGTDASNVLYSDLKLQEIVRNTHPTAEELIEQNEYMKNMANNFVASNSYVKTLYVMREEGASWGSGSFQLSKVYRQSLGDLPWVKLARQQDGEPVWGALAYDPFSGMGERNDLIVPIARVIKDFETLDDIGYLFVNLDGEAMLEQIGQVKLGQTGRLFVIDAEGRVVVDKQQDQIGQLLTEEGLRQWAANGREAEFEYAADGVRYYNIKQPLANGWTVVGSVPIHEITDELTSMRRLIWTSAAGFALLAVLIGLAIASLVTRPIKLLTGQMKRVENGDLSVRTEVRSQDEFGLMSRQFNKMIKRVDELLQEVQTVQESKRQAELRAVAHRIHPHFLFNTLSTIKWLIRYNQSDKAYEAISALVLLLEANMGKKGNFVALEDELDIIRKYLTILEIRYETKFRLHVRCGEEARRFVIPRMLVQPLVENAIFHGIVPTGREGDIWVDVADGADRIVMTVTDNGRGLPPEQGRQLEDIGEAVRGGMTGIGLMHVHEAIRLYYPAGSRLEVRGGEAGGTVVVMQLLKQAGNGARGA